LNDSLLFDAARDVFHDGFGHVGDEDGVPEALSNERYPITTADE